MTDRVTLAHPDLPAEQTIEKPNRPRTLAHYEAGGWYRVATLSTAAAKTTKTTATASRRRSTKTKE